MVYFLRITQEHLDNPAGVYPLDLAIAEHPECRARDEGFFMRTHFAGYKLHNSGGLQAFFSAWADDRLEEYGPFDIAVDTKKRYAFMFGGPAS